MILLHKMSFLKHNDFTIQNEFSETQYLLQERVAFMLTYYWVL
jgi:hypothetical protein